MIKQKFNYIMNEQEMNIVKKFKEWSNINRWDYDENDILRIHKYFLKYENMINNPYVYLEAMKEYAKKNNKMIKILEFIIKNDLLYKKNRKRKPLLEWKYILYYNYVNRYHLSEWEIKLLYFSIKLGFRFPGIIGNAVDELSFKNEDENPGISMEQCEKIVKSQNNTRIEGINTEYFISQTKGGLSLDFGFGCSMGCIYCYRIEDHREMYSHLNKLKFRFDTNESIKRLLNHPWFTPHITPLGICMSTTEAFLPEVWPITIKLLMSLDELKLTNRVTIITKGTLSEEQIKQLEELEYIDLDICVCYAGLPKIIEPSSNTKRIEFLERLVKGERINAIGYLRPIIEGYNTSYEILKEVLMLYKKSGVKTITYGGLRFSDEHVINFQNANIPLPNCVFEKNKKFMSEDTETLIYRAFYEVFGYESECYLFRHSSCARVNVRDSYLPDYNCHYYVKSKKCDVPCKKKVFCKMPIVPSCGEVDALIKRMFWDKVNYDIKNNRLVFDRVLTLFERNFLRQNLLFPAFGCDDDRY